ncbi:MAG: DUF5996 family protein [Sphingomonas sp.]
MIVPLSKPSMRRCAASIRSSSAIAPASSARASPVHFFWGSFDLAVTRFSGGWRRGIPAASPACPTRSPARPIATRKRAPASGRAATPSRRRPSMPTAIRRRRAMPRPRSRRPPITTRRSANGCSTMTRFARRPIRNPCSRNSSSRPTPPPPTSATGIAARSNASRAFPESPAPCECSAGDAAKRQRRTDEHHRD